VSTETLTRRTEHLQEYDPTPGIVIPGEPAVSKAARILLAVVMTIMGLGFAMSTLHSVVNNAAFGMIMGAMLTGGFLFTAFYLWSYRHG
jgi:hypothetical protein